VAWSKSLSNEVAADGVTVNAILPGRIGTARVEELDRLASARQASRRRDREAGRIPDPDGRHGRLDEFGSVAAFLVSERASYITGAVGRVDVGALRSV
jgi:3-oxoacyl-[acyl-carrier protein] reductase